MREYDFGAGAWLGAFADSAGAEHAVDLLRARGYEHVDVFAPWYAERLIAKLPLAKSKLPLFIFAAAALGALLAYGIQWYANVVSYPVAIGGRPAHAVPAFVVATFEGAILAAAMTAFFGVLVALRLPALWHPVFEVPGFARASSDRFWVAVLGSDPAGGRDPEPLLRELGAAPVHRIEARQ